MSRYATQNDLVLRNLIKFYKKDGNLEKILPIINGEDPMSLRLVDWFVTNYSKKHFVVYEAETRSTKRRFKVYESYKLNLKAYSKKRFDPFCRWERIAIPYGDGTCIQTTIGQLNFFRWGLENGILGYIRRNFDAIERDMNCRNSTAKYRRDKGKKSQTRKRRQELSVSATKSIKKEEVRITVKFD